MINPEVTILMATYNGASFISEQVQSLLDQTYTNWKVYVRDDGSSDETVRIVNEFADIDPRVVLIRTVSDVHGACANFSELFSWAKNNIDVKYLMFCDQDDRWLPNKIHDTLTYLNTKEKEQGEACLVYGHLNTMDEQGVDRGIQIAMGTVPGFSNIIVQNPMFGCTMMLNKSLFDFVPFIPKNAENHDYWLALVAVAFGHVSIIPNDILLYRQHRNNVTSQGSSFVNRFNRYSKNSKLFKELNSKIIMLGEFQGMYAEKLKPSFNVVLKDFLNAYKSRTPLNLIKVIIRYKIYKMTRLQTVAMMCVMVLNYNRIRINMLNNNFFKISA